MHLKCAVLSVENEVSFDFSPIFPIYFILSVYEEQEVQHLPQVSRMRCPFVSPYLSHSFYFICRR